MFPIYSEACIQHLSKALKLAEKECAEDDFRRFYEPPSGDDSSSSSSSSSSSMSRSINETDQALLDDGIDLHNEGNKESDISVEKERQKDIKKNRKITQSNKEKETEALVRQLGKPQMVELPLDEDDSGSVKFLELPSSLLSKEQRLSDRRTICKSYYDLAISLTRQSRPVVIILLRSGRFAATILRGDSVLQQTTSTRYTIRKGQGKAQSAQDQKRRPKSVGSQLRRQGEEALRRDVTNALQQWKKHVENAGLILISCPKAMLKNFFDDNSDLIDKSDSRLRKIPLDTSRPTHHTTLAVHQIMLTASVTVKEENPINQNAEKHEETAYVAPIEEVEVENKVVISKENTCDDDDDDMIPLNSLHEYSLEGKPTEIVNWIEENKHDDVEALAYINQPAGPEFMTPLHYAAAVSTVEPIVAAACVTALLIKGKADPTIKDIRNRPPYFLSCHDKVREAFRMARATLGEAYCDWEELAKVGPPLTTDDLELKRMKAAEKKKRQRARQKEKKARERAEAAAAEEKRKQEQETEEQAAKERKETRKKANSCDFCGKQFKPRSQPYLRLQYKYCSTDCVQKHKRELMASAALARFG